MPTFPKTQNAFSGGIFGPALSAREDLSAYEISVKDALNVDFMVQGGVTLRPGIAYLGLHRGQIERCDLTSAVLTLGTGGTGGGAGNGTTPPADDPPSTPPRVPNPWDDFITP